MLDRECLFIRFGDKEKEKVLRYYNVHSYILCSKNILRSTCTYYDQRAQLHAGKYLFFDHIMRFCETQW